MSRITSLSEGSCRADEQSQTPNQKLRNAWGYLIIKAREIHEDRGFVEMGEER